MITMNDIRKFGKDITVNGKTVVETVDFLTNGIVVCGICNKNSARKSVIKDISNGLFGHELSIAFSHIETMKTLNVLV